MSLTEEIKALCRKHRADLVGIAPVERFAGAPLRMSPQGLLPGAKSVVVAGIFHGDAAVELGGRPTAQNHGAYAVQGINMNPELDEISFVVARFLEERGFKGLPIAASNVWRYYPYKDLDVSFAPELAHRYAAVAAGLGEIGWSGLALTPQFGPRNRFVSVVTDAELEGTPMYEGPPLCDKCMECVKRCPTDAFRKEVKKINRIEIGGKVFKFPDTNKWRCGWAENFCLDLQHEIPEKVDEQVILDYLEAFGMRAGEEGSCLRFCMTPQMRYYDEEYTDAPRRRKEILEDDPEKLWAAIQEVLDKAGIDVCAAGRKEDLDMDGQVHPELHLPDVESVISIGMRIPSESRDNGDFMIHAQYLLNDLAFDVAHVLELAGHSARSFLWRAARDLPPMALGIYDTDISYRTVLTSAKLPREKHARRKAQGLSRPEEIRAFCRETGADLVGFFSADRFKRFKTEIENTDLSFKEAEAIEDGGPYYGPYVPETRTEPVGTKEPNQWLPGARSVIVMGLHFPDVALDVSKVTPAETVGPFTFVRYESQKLLGFAAVRLIRKLNDAGFRGVATADLSGLASTVKNSRGMLPDMRANRFAALLGGLAYIGTHGCPITPEYGTRQVFIAVVTDMDLPDDPLYRGEILCRTCEKPCVGACPTAAIGDATVPIALEGVTFDIPRVDPFSCDWAKRYCLSGEEGPKYSGVAVDEPVPQDRSAAQIAAAVCRVKWGVQKLHVNIVEECVRVCPARGRQ